MLEDYSEPSARRLPANPPRSCLIAGNDKSLGIVAMVGSFLELSREEIAAIIHHPPARLAKRVVPTTGFSMTSYIVNLVDKWNLTLMNNSRDR